MQERELSDTEYSQLYNSLQQQENHVCTRKCEFKLVFGNMWYCVPSGQAHVCDQNCTQRIFYDNHHDICRLSKRVFPRSGPSMHDAPRKRGGEEASAGAAKRPQSADWQVQQQAQVLTEQQQQQQQLMAGAGGHWQAPPQAQQGWAF